MQISLLVAVSAGFIWAGLMPESREQRDISGDEMALLNKLAQCLQTIPSDASGNANDGDNSNPSAKVWRAGSNEDEDFWVCISEPQESDLAFQARPVLGRYAYRSAPFSVAYQLDSVWLDENDRDILVSHQLWFNLPRDRLDYYSHQITHAVPLTADWTYVICEQITYGIGEGADTDCAVTYHPEVQFK